MKGILIVIISLCCVTQVKAQQAPLLFKQQPLQQFNAFPDSLKGKDLAFKMMDSARRFNNNPAIGQNIIANANMPMVRPQINSKMPIVQTDRTGYTMPVVGMQKPRVYIMNKPNEQKPVAPASNNDVK